MIVATGVNPPSGKREITFIVTDTGIAGIGIPNDKKEILFRAFSQVDESHSRSYGGTGLGLVISMEIVERMGGTISFASEEAKGSIFSCTIPFDEAKSECDAISESVKTMTAKAPLGRSVKNLVDLVGELLKQGVQFKNLTDAIDTGTPSGRFFFHIMASLAEMERELTIERTRAGLEVARPLGRTGGRKRLMTDSKIESAKKLLDSGVPPRDVAKRVE